MSDQPPALRAAVADLQRALAGQPAESVSKPADTTRSSDEAPAEDEPPRQAEV